MDLPLHFLTLQWNHIIPAAKFIKKSNDTYQGPIKKLYYLRGLQCIAFQG